jgi:hypothetical protein
MYDENYSAFIFNMAPCNCLLLPFVPYALFKKPSKEFNTLMASI